MKRIYSLIIILCLILSFTGSIFAADFDVENSISEIEKAKMAEFAVDSIQALVDKMSEKPAAGNEWWIMAIRNRYENLDYTLYRSAMEKFLNETPPSSSASKERCSLALVSLESGIEYANSIIDDAIETKGINTYIFALHLLNNGVSSKYSKGDIVSLILGMQCDDGGWSLNGSYGDPDITAMAIQSLSVYTDNNDVLNAIDRAIEYLSSIQLNNGGYSSYGNENPESPAQVICALASIGIDAKNDERFIKNGNTLFDAIESFNLGDGNYSHTRGGDVNATSQTQVYYCYVAYEMFLNSQGSFYSFSTLSEKLIEREVVDSEKEIDVKFYFYIAIGIVILILCLLKILKKEKKLKSYISILLVGILAIFAVSFINIESEEEYYQKSENENSVFTTISIYCDTVKGQADYIPKDGKILEYKPMEVPEGASVYDQLVDACKEYKLQMESNGDSYVNGIDNLYEYSFGELSGWMFKVNGEFSDVGCNAKKLKDGDYVEWVYTTNLGKDVGKDFAEER